MEMAKPEMVAAPVQETIDIEVDQQNELVAPGQENMEGEHQSVYTADVSGLKPVFSTCCSICSCKVGFGCAVEQFCCCVEMFCAFAKCPDGKCPAASVGCPFCCRCSTPVCFDCGFECHKPQPACSMANQVCCLDTRAKFPPHQIDQACCQKCGCQTSGAPVPCYCSVLPCCFLTPSCKVLCCKSATDMGMGESGKQIQEDKRTKKMMMPDINDLKAEVEELKAQMNAQK